MMSSMIRALTFSALFVSVSSQQLETLTVRGLLRGAKDTALRHLFLCGDSSSEEGEEMVVARYDVGLTVDVPDTISEPALLVPMLEGAIQSILPVNDTYTFVATSVGGTPIGRTDYPVPMTGDVMKYYDCNGDCAPVKADLEQDLAGSGEDLFFLLDTFLIQNGELETAINAALTAASMPTLTFDNAAIAGTLTVSDPTITIEVVDE